MTIEHLRILARPGADTADPTQTSSPKYTCTRACARVRARGGLARLKTHLEAFDYVGFFAKLVDQCPRAAARLRRGRPFDRHVTIVVVAVRIGLTLRPGTRAEQVGVLSADTNMAKTLLIIFPPSWGDPFARIKYGTFI